MTFLKVIVFLGFTVTITNIYKKFKRNLVAHSLLVQCLLFLSIHGHEVHFLAFFFFFFKCVFNVL